MLQQHVEANHESLIMLDAVLTYQHNIYIEYSLQQNYLASDNNASSLLKWFCNIFLVLASPPADAWCEQNTALYSRDSKIWSSSEFLYSTYLLCSQMSSAWHKYVFVFCVILQNIAVSTGSAERVANGESTAGDETPVSKEEENKTGFVKFGWVKGVLVRNSSAFLKKNWKKINFKISSVTLRSFKKEEREVDLLAVFFKSQQCTLSPFWLLTLL